MRHAKERQDGAMQESNMSRSRAGLGFSGVATLRYRRPLQCKKGAGGREGNKKIFFFVKIKALPNADLSVLARCCKWLAVPSAPASLSPASGCRE